MTLPDQLPRVTYLFRAGRRERMAEPGEYPSEFFYGFQQLSTYGFDVHLAEDRDLAMAPPLPLLARLVNKAARFAGQLPIGMAFSLLMTRSGRLLDDAGLVIATTTGMGLSLAIGTIFGQVRTPVLLIAMGLLPTRPGRLKAWGYRALVRRIHVVCISRGEQTFLQGIFNDRPVHYIPFGVDADFWRPAAEDGGDGKYVLAIGNDRHRDWATLAAAWREDLPPLKIVTSLPVPAAPSNVEVVRGDWRTRVLSDHDIRDLLQGARFVIVPVQETTQPSGQSACLQAMACGKAVILTRAEGLWDTELMVDRETVMLVPPKDPAALRDAARVLTNDAKIREGIEGRARQVIDEHLNVKAMSAAMADLVKTVSA